MWLASPLEVYKDEIYKPFGIQKVFWNQKKKKSHFEVWREREREREICLALWDRLKNTWRFAEYFEIKTHFWVYKGEDYSGLGIKSTSWFTKLSGVY